MNEADFEKMKAMDISGSFLALCTALEKKGVLTKREIAEAAQERLVTLTTLLRVEAEELPLLHGLATKFETWDPKE